MSQGIRLIAVLCAWWALMLPAAGMAADYGFRILRAEMKLNESGSEYLLDADIDYRFSEPAIDALRNGVPLTLALRIVIKRDRGWWWGAATVLDEKFPFRIRYHALSKLYQIIYENSESPRNFSSINALLEDMGAIRDLPVLPANRLRKGERYRASLAVSLDIESLPLPLRPVAYVTPAWYLDSPRYRWTFVN